MSEEPERPEFSVWIFRKDVGTHFSEDEWRFLMPEQAVKIALRLTRAAALSDLERIIIVDGGDFTVWEWKPGEGITFPPELAGKLK